MIRLHILVEGQTEEEFVNSVLTEHLGDFNISTDVRSVITSRDRKKNINYRGGMSTYQKAKRDLERWMKEDNNSDSFFTTMFDLYALPKDFPKFDESQTQSDPYQRIADLETAFAEDLAQAFSTNVERLHFTPYIQLHEFEALILSDPEKFSVRFIEHDKQIKRLVALCLSVHSPELINDGEETAPSKQIIKEIPEYKGAKASAGPLIAKEIGIHTLREKCPHFNEWITALEKLDTQ
jgi:hypothetical protein